MRILHIGKFYPPFHGGIESFLSALVESQTRAGHSVSALVHSHAPDGHPLPPDWTTPPPWIVRAPCYGRLLYAPISPAFPIWMARVVGEFRPEIIHLHLPNTSAFWALALPSARKVPWVIHWHADVVESSIDRRLKIAYQAYRPFERALLRRASAIVATSPPYLESSSALRPWRAKCRVVPLGLPPLEPTPLASASPRIEWRPGLLRVLAIGRLTYYKGFDILIHALVNVPNAQAIIVGEGELRAKLESALSASGIANRVRLVGRLSTADCQYLQDTCDVFCLPSLERTEAFGVVLLEAMQRAKPVIASDIPGSGIGWVVMPGETGVLNPPADVPGLAGKLRSMNEPELRARLGQAGLARFEQNFDIVRVADRLDQVYREVMAQRSS